MQLKLSILLLFFATFIFAQSPVPAPKKNGKFEKKDGKKIVESGLCHNGFKIGTWMYNYPTESISSRQEDYTEDGILIRYRNYLNHSMLVEEYNLSHDILNGNYSLFVENYSGNRTPQITGVYLNGKKDSIWVYYRKFNAKQNLWKKEIWKSDTLIEILKYYSTGQLFHTIEFNSTDSIQRENYFDTTGLKIVLVNYTDQQLKHHDSLYMDSLMRFHHDSTKARPDDYYSYFQETVMEFPGGQKMINSFINSNMRNVNSSIEAKIYVNFVVNKYGEVENVVVKKHNEDLTYLENEAIRVVEMMPPWQPATQNGRPVRVSMNLPFHFVSQY